MYNNDTTYDSNRYYNGYGYGYNNGGGSFFFLFFLILPFLLLICCVFACFRHRRGTTYFPGYFSRLGGGTGWGSPAYVNNATPAYSNYSAGTNIYNGQRDYARNESEIAQPTYPSQVHTNGGVGVGNVR